MRFCLELTLLAVLSAALVAAKKPKEKPEWAKKKLQDYR